MLLAILLIIPQSKVVSLQPHASRRKALNLFVYVPKDSSVQSIQPPWNLWLVALDGTWPGDSITLLGDINLTEKLIGGAWEEWPA